MFNAFLRPNFCTFKHVISFFLLDFSHAGDDEIDTVRERLAVLVVHLPALVQHLLDVGFILDLLDHSHWLLFCPLELLTLDEQVVALPVSVLEILLQLLDDIGHFLLVAAFLGLELAD